MKKHSKYIITPQTSRSQFQYVASTGSREFKPVDKIVKVKEADDSEVELGGFRIEVPSFRLVSSMAALDLEVAKIRKVAKGLPHEDEVMSPSLLFFEELAKVKSGETSWLDFFAVTGHSAGEVANAYTLFLGSAEYEGACLPDLTDVLVNEVVNALRRSKNKGIREVTLFYFNCFSVLQDFPSLSAYLESAWKDNKERLWGQQQAWREYSAHFFNLDATVASIGLIKGGGRSGGENFDHFLVRLGIPEASQFRQELQLQYFIRKVEEADPAIKDDELWDELILHKEDFVSGRKFGGRVAQTMIERVQLEFNNVWPSKWCDLLIPISSDPRGASVVWWSWADRNALATARRAMLSRAIAEFLNAVERTNRSAPQQWHSRRSFLEGLLTKGKIEEIWLMMKQREIRAMTKEARKAVAPLPIRSQISFICLKCVGGIYILEGSETCRIRAWSEADFPFEQKFRDVRLGKENFLKDEDLRGVHHMGAAPTVSIVHHEVWENEFIEDVRSRLGVNLAT